MYYATLQYTDVYVRQHVLGAWDTGGLAPHCAMRIKGLSKGEIKQIWRDGKLGDLPTGTRVGVDAAGWIHKACVRNAVDLCLERGTATQHAHIVHNL